MGKNRKNGMRAAQPQRPGPQQGMRPPAPPRGPAPVFPMGPPGQRFPAPHRDFGPQPPRMRMRMMDDREGDRGFMHDGPYHPMDIPDRHEFRPRFDGPDPGFHHPEFGNRPAAPRFYHPELEYGPRFRSPEFCDRPPDFCPPEFRGRPASFHPAEFEGGPGFHRMNPGFDQMEQYGLRDPHYMPQMDPHFIIRSYLHKQANFKQFQKEKRQKGTRLVTPKSKNLFLYVSLKDNVKEANPGCIRTIISKDPIKLTFGKVDSNVTLLLYDRVEFQLLTNVITKEQRATNIKPKTPDTFQLTKEVRETGVIINKSDGTVTIMTEKHDSLTASATDNLTDEELNVSDDVELTILTVNNFCALGNFHVLLNVHLRLYLQWKPVTSEAGSQDLDVSSEIYEGTITKIAPKKSQSQEKQMDNQELTLGLLVTTVEGTEKRLSFRSGDVITKATMMVDDKVQFNICTNSVTKEECAVNVEILPETFQTDSEEQRKIGLVVKLDDNFGFIKTQQDPQLFFDTSEVMEDTKLTLSEKVEFTLVPVTEGGKQAVRIRRLNENVFTSAPKLEAFGVKEKVQYITFISLIKRSRSRSKEREERSRRSRSRSRERSSQSARKRSRSPADKYDHYAKQSRIKDPSDKKKVKSPDSVEDELLRKRRELMELNELIARKKAIVAMEHNAKKIEPEDGKSGVTTFDYEHVHRENIWMPDLKPVKSILKKQSEPHTDSQSQASASKETAAPFVKSESQEMQIGYHHQTCAFGSNTPGYSTFKCIAERTLTTAGSEKTSLTQIQDPKLVRKKKQLEDLSESIARKRAIIALEQKVKVVRGMPEMEAEYKFDSHTEDQFVMSKGNLWSSEIKPDIQPKKSILKKRSEIVTSQSDKTSVDEYGQPSQDDSSFTKPTSQKTATLPLNRSSNPQPIHPGMLGLFSRIMNASSAASQMTETPPFNKPVIPQSLTKASSSRSLHDQKSSSLSKGSNSQNDQHRASSRLPHDHPLSSNPSTSQTSTSDPKRNLSTQMERFLSALNKADTSVVNSLFQEARKDLTLINAQKPTQLQLDRNIPFMDEIYDPFKDEDGYDQPSLIGKQSGQERVKTETRLNDPSKDDLLPHERAVQDGSGFSQLVGMKYGVDPTAKAEKKSPYGYPMVSESWSAHKEDPNQFSEQWNQYEQDTDLYATEHKHYTDERSVYRERSPSVEYQNVSPNVQHSYIEDREMPDSKFDKSLVRQESEESSEDKNRKSENFEKIQSLLQTIGLHLDTAEVSKLADRTQERLYGKTKKPHSAPTHSFEQKREQSVSQPEQRGSGSRADSSDSEGFRSVSPAQSSNRKVYMSYKDSVKYKDQHKVEDVDLTSIKRTVVNLIPATNEQDPCEPEPTAVSKASYQPMTIVTTVQPATSQYAQNSTVSTFSASQYSQYQSSDQHVWGSVAPGLYPYGTLPPSPYGMGHQAMVPHMMSAYSSYTAQMASPYYGPPPLSMPHPYGPPPIPNPLHFSTMASAYCTQAASQIPNESIKTKPVRCLKTIETVQTVPTDKAGPASTLVTIQPKEDSKEKQTSEEAKNIQVATITEDDIKAKQKKRLEQFNQRMKLKKEQQMEAQRSRGQNRNSAPGIIIFRVFRFRHLLASGAIACLVCLFLYLANRIIAKILQSLFPRKKEQ
uniref:Uncharacterized LOC107564218 n=1 Tax=Sinocyclocheilus grahami TaxID=75366 RepID=A0A672NFV4_SINGR